MRNVLQMLETRDLVQVAELAETFSVSEVTIRSDLTALAKQGLVARVRGGVRALNIGQSEVGFDFRLRLEVERKRAIARAAASLVGEGEAVALDASTTAYFLALELRQKSELVVVTNGLLVATALADAPGITVLVTGGMLRLSAMSLVGDLGTDFLRTTRINKGFLGARGLSLERGLMDLNPDEVRIKQEMADACEQVFGIFDGTKWHRSALLAFVPVDDLAGIITDSSAPADEVQAWRAAGIDVITVDPGPREPLPLRPRDLRRAVRNDRRSADGSDGRRRPRGAERPRRRGTFRRPSAWPSPRRIALPTSRSSAAARSAGISSVSVTTCSTACAPARARRAIDSVARRLVGGRLRPARRGRPARARTPSTTATFGARPRYRRLRSDACA